MEKDKEMSEEKKVTPEKSESNSASNQAEQESENEENKAEESNSDLNKAASESPKAEENTDASETPHTSEIKAELSGQLSDEEIEAEIPVDSAAVQELESSPKDSSEKPEVNQVEVEPESVAQDSVPAVKDINTNEQEETVQVDSADSGEEAKTSEPEEASEAEMQTEEVADAKATSEAEMETKTEETQPAVSKKVDEVEHEEEDHHDEEDHIDYSDFSKKQLIAALKELLGSNNFLKADKTVNEIKTHFDELLHKEKDAALKQFTDQGGIEDDFEFRNSDEDRQFFILLNDFRDKKTAQYKELERHKESNLVAKNKILDTLRELVDGEETTHSISTIKGIQEEWKKIGPVPASQNRNLWASYNALMDRFYDNRSIYFELKELDRKKNLESKLELCEKAEALMDVKDLKEAIKQLNDLHEEFKHIGPVPREEQENLWQKFKEASDAIYSRRKEYYESQKEVFKENQVLKEQLIEKLNAFTEFSAGRIKDWNIKTKEILEMQKEWEKIGPVPREVGKEINRSFWGAFKQFFHNKNLFFKELDEIRQTNKLKAEALIERAEEVMESTDWQGTANTLIGLQKEWKEIGPTPEKVRDDLYKRFKKACDTFFENKRKVNKEVSKEFDQNLELKEQICEKITTAANSDELSPDELEKLILEYQAIGFVPRKNIKDIAAKFNNAVDTYVKKMGLEGVKREEFLFRLNLNKIQGDPNLNRVLNKKEHGIRKQISDLENNVTLWKNNLEFFASSKTADKLKDQFDEKIDKAEKEIEKLKKKLSIIREF